MKDMRDLIDDNCLNKFRIALTGDEKHRIFAQF